MQDYIDLANKNGITLLNKGPCQFCGANTSSGVHECLEIFELGFQGIDFSEAENHVYRFLIVDAHTLQHPEIHGRWNNHFHLSRLHLMQRYKVKWTYDLSPKLSNHLNKYKAAYPDEYLTPPEMLDRGSITSSDIKANAGNTRACKALIERWAEEVYGKWSFSHHIADMIAKIFLANS